MAYSILRRHMKPIEEEMRFFQKNDILRRHMRPFETNPSLFPDINTAERMTQSFYDQLHSALELNGFDIANNGFASFRGNTRSSGNQAGGNTQNTYQQPDDPCNCGLSGNEFNNKMYADEIVRAAMDALQSKIPSVNEWTLSISKSGNRYKVSNLSEGKGSTGKIPNYPDGEKVANAHIHTSDNSGVPSAGDIYSFLKAVRDTKTIKTMFALGSQLQISGKYTLEVYAVNVYDIKAIEAFLKKYPEEENRNFIQKFSGKVGEIFDDAYKRSEKSAEHNERYATTLPNYSCSKYAIALAYTMLYLNMGITLSRKVDNGPFMVISVTDIMIDEQKILDIGVCEE